jgi:WD40 repeat protein
LSPLSRATSRRSRNTSDLAQRHGPETHAYCPNGNPAGVWGLRFSPDGKLLASRSVLDKAIKLVDVATGRELRTFTNEGGPIANFAFSKNGQLLAAGDTDGAIRIWDIQTGHSVRSLAIHSKIAKSPINAIAFSPDGRYLAASIMALSQNESSVRIWNVATWQELNALTGGFPTTLMFTNDSKQLVGVDLGYAVTFWDVTTGVRKSSVKLQDDPVSIQLSAADSGKANPVSYGLHSPILNTTPDNQLLVSGVDLNSQIRIWTVGATLKPNVLGGHDDDITALTFSQTGTILASGGGNLYTTGKSDNSIKLWNCSTGSEIIRLVGHQSTVSALVFSPDGRFLASGSVDGSIRLWNVDTGQEAPFIAKPINYSNHLTFSPDGSRLMAGTRTLWDLSTGQGIRVVERPPDRGENGVVSNDGHLLALGGQTIQIWDTATNRVLFELGEFGEEIKALPLAFSWDGRLLVSVYRSTADPIKVSAFLKPPVVDPQNPGEAIKAYQEYNRKLYARLYPEITKQVIVWDLVTRKELRAISPFEDRNNGMSQVNAVLEGNNLPSLAKLSPDGQAVVIAPAIGSEFTIWNLNDGKKIHSFKSGTLAVRALTFSGDGRFIAAGGMQHLDEREAGENTMIKIWEVATGSEVQILNPGTDIVESVAFSEDGQRLVVATAEGRVSVWDLRTRRVLWTISTGKLNEVAFSPNGRLLAGAHADGSIHLFDALNGEKLLTLISLNDGSDWLAAAPDGLFDGSPMAWRQILWRFTENLFDVAEVESFFSEFYYPDLLAEVIAARKPRAPRNIVQLDRRQPSLRLVADAVSDSNAGSEKRRVRILVDSALAGCRDVRLFRNGSLVKIWRGDVLNGRDNTSLETTIPIIAGENRLTAYAFNRDNIKSADSTLMISGDESARRKTVVYVLAIGLNEYANSQFNLKYAVADAESFAAEFKTQQDRLHNYDRVEVISVNDRTATKGYVLQLLANLSLKVQPEDALIIFFAGHGIAQENRFYFVPYDLGYTGNRAQLSSRGLQEILAHSISDLELEHAVELLDAGHLVLIIDACNSGQALEAEEKRRGPMNSKGLAQLAYEKGMYILTAAQSYQAAHEATLLGHGFLTYALVEEGLKTNAADIGPRDGQVLLREWLEYATQRVPKIQADELEAQRQQGRQLERLKSAKTDLGNELGVQRPRVFYRRETEPHQLVVARP